MAKVPDNGSDNAEGKTKMVMDSFMYRAVAIRAALKLWQKGIKVNRNFTLKRALSICTSYTGRSYTRYMVADAIDDMTVFIERTKSTPIHRS